MRPLADPVPTPSFSRDGVRGYVPLRDPVPPRPPLLTGDGVDRDGVTAAVTGTESRGRGRPDRHPNTDADAAPNLTRAASAGRRAER
jgi:hypothetical protein